MILAALSQQAGAQIIAPDDLARTGYTASPRSISLSWDDNSSNETHFNLELSADGGTSWSALGQVGTGTTTFSGTLPAGETLLFFRVLATDGTDFSTPSNIISIEGTDPATSDTDGDGMTDSFEMLNGLDPYFVDAYEDADGDRYPNIFEYARGSDPGDPESVPAADYIADNTVSPSGNIYSTIQAALDQVVANHRVVRVRDGVFSGSGNVNLTISATHSVLLMGENGARSTIVDGGGTARLVTASGESVIDGLTFRNGAADEGGAAYVGGGNLLVVNCVFSGNQAIQDGGALYQAGGSTLVVHSTFLDNSAGGEGAAVYVDAGDLSIAKSILWNSGTAAEVAFSGSGATVEVTESIVRGGFTGTGNLNIDPLTRFDGHLTVDSPAIDSGGVLQTALLDMDGEERPMGMTTDIGADEWLDTDADDLPDWWELDRFGLLTASGSGDPDGDSLTNLAEYEAGGDPEDYYDQGGTTISPTLTIISGNGQTGDPSTFATQPLLVEATSGTTALVNAPVTFTVTGSGGGQIALSTSGTGLTSTLPVVTGSDGRAQVYLKYPSAYATTSTVEALAGSGTNTSQVIFTATTSAIPTSGLRLWLKADAGVTMDGSNYVSAWGDQSGYSNDGSQSTSSARPLWVDNVFNGKPVLRFDGTNDFLTTGTNSSLVTTDFTFVVITAFNSTTGDRALLSRDVGSGSNNKWIYWYSGGKMQFHINPGNQTLNSTSFTRTVGQLEALAVTKSGRDYRHFRGGQVYGTVTATVDIPSINSDFRIGQAENNFYLNGDVAEVLAYDHQLTWSDKVAIESYLTGKYGLSFSSDADGDGMPNSYESDNGLDPYSDDQQLDKDGDGIPNKWEFAKGTEAGNAASATADWVVDPANAGASTTDNIVATIAEAITAVPVDNGNIAASYKSIRVEAGSYAENVTIPSNKRIALVGERGGEAKLVGSSLSSAVLTMSQRSVVDGLVISRPAAAIQSGTVTGAGVYVGNSSAQGVGRLVNCIVYGNAKGIEFAAVTTGAAQVEYCTVFGNETAELWAPYRDRIQTVKNCVIWNPLVGATNQFGSSTSYTTSLAGNIVYGGQFGGTNADPLLNADGTLRSGSSAIDAGIGSLVVGGDIHGEARPSGSARDMGADEYVDSDADSLPDAWEMRWFGDLDEIATNDGDADNLSNLEEALAGTDPTNDDADGDGAKDDAEIAAGTSPFVPDSDGDGMLDGYEIDNALNPLADDQQLDKDGDGIPNKWEFAKGTEAGNAASATADWVVDPANAEASTPDNIVATIGEAITAVPVDNGNIAASYKSIWVKAGTYAENVTIPSNKRIALVGERGGEAKLVGSSLSSAVLTMSQRSVVDGLVISRPAAAIQSGTVTGAGVYVGNSSAQGVGRLVNCIVYGHAKGIEFAAVTTGAAQVEYCTVFGNNTAELWAPYRDRIVTVKNCVIWNPLVGATNQFGSSTSYTTSLAGNIVYGGQFGGTNADPVLSVTGLLQAGSGAIGAASGTSIWSDIQGEARPEGSARDIGADEWLDSDSDNLPDAWEIKTFGGLGEIGSADLDGDGLTNAQEFGVNSDPANYFSQGGTLLSAFVTLNGGNNQAGPPGAYLDEALSVEVRSGTAGAYLANAPVVFAVSGGNGGLAASHGSVTTSGTITVTTGSNGVASAYFHQTGGSALTSTVTARSGTSAVVTFTERTTLADGLWSSWTFNEGVGSVAVESAGFTNSGTLANLADWTQGFDGRTAVLLSGSTSHVSMGNPASNGLDFGAGSFSIATWVKYTEVPGSGETRRIVSKGLSGWGAGYMLGLVGDGKLAFGLGSSGTTADQAVLVKTTGTYNDGLWHHVGVVVDRVGGSVRIYVDGTANSLEKEPGTGGSVGAESISLAGLASLNASGTTASFTVSSYSGTADFFKGGVDELRIYRKPLASGEIGALFNVDSDSNSLPDRWEWAHFGDLGISGGADGDGDGMSNLEEYTEGSDPNDYFSQGSETISPVVTKISGDDQLGPIDEYLNQPLIVEVRSGSAGPVLENAPVTYTVSSGSGGVAAADNALPTSSTISIRTGTDGRAGAWFRHGPIDGVTDTISVVSGSSAPVVFSTESTPKLWSRWKFDEGTGSVAEEASGNGGDGTLVNATAWSGGFNDQGGVEFSGTNSHVTMGQPTGRPLDFGAGDFSVSFWINFTGEPSATESRRILGKGFTSFGEGYFVGLVGDGKLAAGLGSPSEQAADALLFKTMQEISDGKWHHVAVIFDQSNGVGRIYIDGSAANLEKVSGTGGTIGSWAEVIDFSALETLSGSNSGEDFTVAAAHDTSDPFIGQIDELRIYRTALDEGDVLALYHFDGDSDGLPDWWEIAMLGDLDADGDDDTDSDGLTNMEEFAYGTDPQDADSDDDGMSDADEVDEGRDPLDEEALTLGLEVYTRLE